MMRRFARRRAGVALIFALASPMLIGATGVAMDISYWYQEQENLQTAADAAAMAAANAETAYPTNVTTAAQAQPFAQQAANLATGGQYNFGGGSATVSVTPIASGSNTQWTATAAAPRLSFFSAVQGIGVRGFGTGTQTAAAAADYVPGAQNDCLLVTGPSGTDITTGSGGGSGGRVVANGCGMYSESSSNCSLEAENGTRIEGTTIATAGTACANTNTGSYIGTSLSGTGASAAGGNGVVQTNVVPADLVGNWDSELTWPSPTYTPPAALTPSPALATYYIPNNALNGSANQSFSPYGACNGGGKVCQLVTGISYQNFSSAKITSITLGSAASNSTSPATTGVTEVTGGIYGSGAANSVTIGGAEFFLTGGVGIGFSGTFSTNPGAGNSGNYVFEGDFDPSASTSSAAVSLGLGTYYFYNPGNEAMGFLSPITLSGTAGSTYYFDGTVNLSNFNNAGSVAFGQGTYYFNNEVHINNGVASFGGGTYYFSGGLVSDSDNNVVSFGPGIYYVKGNLWLQGKTVTATGATFILENGATYTIKTNSNETISLSAPTTNCVTPAVFGGGSTNTNGEGICNVLIYEERSTTAASTIEADSPITLNGIISQYNSELDLSGGNSTVGGSGSNLFEVEAASVNNPNTTKLTLTAPANAGGVSSTALALLVQ